MIRPSQLILALILPLLAGAGRPLPEAVDHVIEVRGVPMHFRIYKGDRRTILLEAGSGLGAATWNQVAPRIAARTGATVVSYDRAGFGGSAPLATPYDVHEEVARLHMGLYALDRDRRLILVGHSYGGYLIQLYSNLYPRDVRGMVYVDPNTPRSIDGVGGARAIAEARIKANDVPMPTAQQTAGLRLSHALEQTQETMRRYPPLCGVPVAVITAGRNPPETPIAKIAGWRAGHRELVDATGGEAIMADRAGHMVHRDQPELVVETVVRVASRKRLAHPKIGAVGRACRP